MTTRNYVLPVEQPEWRLPGRADAVFTWNYDEKRENLLALYEKGKDKQWNSTHRLDWSRAVDESNPLGFPDYAVTASHSPVWKKLSERERGVVRQHLAGWQFSQFLHAEQGGVLGLAKIVQSVPQLDAKFYAGTQLLDEVRHVEVFSRYLNEKIKVAYPINRHMTSLLDQILRDPRWDFTCIGFQVIIEGLALAAFQAIRDMATEPLARALTAYVMQDEARHVAFGRLALRDYYKELTESERNEREEFVVEACYLMRDRFLLGEEDVWVHLDLGAKAFADYLEHSKQNTQGGTRKLFFRRIVPTIKDIGLWGPKVQAAFADMGVIGFADLNSDAIGAADELKGQEIEKTLHKRP